MIYTSASTLLSDSISELKNLKVGEEFILSDLFKLYEWKRIPLGIRGQAGNQFDNINNNIYLRNGCIVRINDESPAMYRVVGNMIPSLNEISE